MAGPDPERLLKALRAAPPGGLGIRELLKAVGLKAADAQRLRRQLVALEAQGLVHGTGRTKARRYFAGPGTPQLVPAAAGVPLSFDAARLWSRLGRPLMMRQPVSYRRELLDGYQPNRTWYLPAALRERLDSAGRTAAAGQPAGTYARQVLERLLIDLSWNSARLEGNTYSLLDTERLLARGEAAEGKDQRETQMLLDHKAAIEFLVGDGQPPSVDVRTLKNLHALLADNLLASPLDAGRLRTAPVAISESVYIPLANPQLLDECFGQLASTAAAIADPFEQSFFLLVHLPYLQPFIDGNKRTARLAANIPFIRHNLVPLSFIDVDRESFTMGVLGVYEENDLGVLRDVFTFAYERSAARLGAIRASLGEPDPFRLLWRQELKAAVGDVVRRKLKRKDAEQALRKMAAKDVPAAERSRFLGVALSELDALHEGNFARYAVRPSEYDAWARTWRLS